MTEIPPDPSARDITAPDGPTSAQPVRARARRTTGQRLGRAALGLMLLLLGGLSASLLWAVPELNVQAAQRLREITAQLDAGALQGPPVVVECRLSGGAKTLCVAITVKQTPTTMTPGPWCPRQISDGADKGGIWLDQGQVHAVDGSFIARLASFYKDAAWQMFDLRTGAVKVTDSREACEAAARPDVDPKYSNHCVECQTAYLAADATVTYVIALQPVASKRTGTETLRGPPGAGGPGPGPADGAGPGPGPGPIGLSYSGLRLDGPAPVQAILGARTLAPFDRCGGHVNLHVGYHVHAVTDCMVTLPGKDPAHAALVGIAMDGWPIHARTGVDGLEPADLDVCRGHHTSALGYHYHVAAPGANAILNCQTAQTGCALDDANQACDSAAQSLDRGVPGPPPGGRPPPRR